MDRLHAVTVGLCVALAAGACDDQTSKTPSRSASRVNAVAAKPTPKAPAPDAFCDVYHPADTAPAFALPELAQDSDADTAPAPTAEGWRWINIWASWCVPCVEEMPLLVQWQDELGEAGLEDLVLVSVDDTAEKVEAFRKKHPQTPESLRITSPDALEPWLETVGVEQAASLPVHLFVDPAGKVRCVRAGGVNEDDYAAVERVLSE